MSEPTIRQSINAYIETVANQHSLNTENAYRKALKFFVISLQEHGIDVDSVKASHATEDWIVNFFRGLRGVAPSSANQYYWAIVGWYKFLVVQGLAKVNIERVKLLTRPHIPRLVKSSSQPPSYYQISRIVNYVLRLGDTQVSNELERLRILRDRALIITLADTGMEVSVACDLRRGDIDWRNNCFLLTGKGMRKASIGFSPRVSKVLLDYLNARAPLDKAMGRSQKSMPVFARHRSHAEDKMLPIGTQGIKKIVAQRASEALGAEYDGVITPKSFRHYFVTTVLESFASLHPKVANKCQVHFGNGQYDDAIFNAMKVIEEEVRSRVLADPTDLGVNLITKAMQTKPISITFSQVAAEQESAYYLFRGAIGSFKNPQSHRFIGVSDPAWAFECLALASLLMRMLDEAA